MNDMPIGNHWDIPPDLLARIIGAVSGSAVSLAYLLPKGRREAALRFFTGLACGMVFGGPAGIHIADWLGMDGRLASFEIVMSGAAATSLCAWWALGILSRMAASFPASRA
jgi:predicted MFS family arabinose efflux permease